jgi:hypothetical protein
VPSGIAGVGDRRGGRSQRWEIAERLVGPQLVVAGELGTTRRGHWRSRRRRFDSGDGLIVVLCCTAARSGTRYLNGNSAEYEFAAINSGYSALRRLRER